MYKIAEVTIMQLYENPDGRRANSSCDIYDMCEDFVNAAQEQTVVFTLDIKSRVIQRHLVALGTVNTTLVCPREVFRPAIMDAATSIILVHNHPSGDPSPSAADLKMTKQIIEAGRYIEIPVIDHIIVGRKEEGRRNLYSIRESGLADFVR